MARISLGMIGSDETVAAKLEAKAARDHSGFAGRQHLCRLTPAAWPVSSAAKVKGDDLPRPVRQAAAQSIPIGHPDR